MRSVVVVGGSVAGVSAVEALREQGYDGHLTLVDAGGDLPHDKPPLSKGALAGDVELESTAFHPVDWYEEHGVDVRLDARAVGLDPAHGELALTSGQVLAFDGMVVATGSTPRPLPVPCSDPSRLHVLRTLEDSRRLRAELQPGRHLVIIGGGFIGLEAAATARSLGLRVTVLEAAPTLLNRVFPAEVGAWFEQLHRDRGVVVRCAAEIQQIDVGSDCVKVRLPDETLSADVVLTGVGCAPSVGWLEGSGVATGDGVLCAADLRTTVPNVVAAGDVAHWPNLAMDEEMRIGHWTNAVEQGRHAVATLLGAPEPYRSIPYFWTDQYDAKTRFVGRARPGDDVVIGVPRDGALVALFGRNGTLRGAVCVNATRHLAQYRAAIHDRVPWHDAVSTLPG